MNTCVDGQMDRLDRGLLSWRQWGRERKCIIYFLRSQKSGSHHSRVLSHDPVVALVLWPVPHNTCSPPRAPGDPSSQGHFHMNSGKRERRGVRCSPGTTQSPCPPTHMGPHSLRPPKNSHVTFRDYSTPPSKALRCWQIVLSCLSGSVFFHIHTTPHSNYLWML